MIVAQSGTLYSQAHEYFELEITCMHEPVNCSSEKYPDWDRKKVEKKYVCQTKKKRI